MASAVAEQETTQVEATNGKKRQRRLPSQLIFTLEQETEAKEVLKQIPEASSGTAAKFNVYKVTNAKGDKGCLVIAASPMEAMGRAGLNQFGYKLENLTGSSPGFALTPEKAAAFLKTLPDEERNRIIKELSQTGKKK